MQARERRVEREETRRIDTELRARREKVKIEPPPAPVVEKSDRAKREQQIPLFHVGDGSGLPPLAMLDDPKPQPKGYDEDTLETLSRQIEFKLKDSASTPRWSVPSAGDPASRSSRHRGSGRQISSLDRTSRAA